MASRSAEESSSEQPPTIIPFIPRQRVRQCVQHLLGALTATPEQQRRLLAVARATFGDDLVAELQRVISVQPVHQGHAAIAILLELASAAAHDALWAVARDPSLHPALRLAALRGLCQQGADVPINQLVALANQCERAPRARERDQP